MGLNINVRVARESDAETIAAIESLAFETDKIGRAALIGMIGRHDYNVLAAELEGDIVGFCIVKFRPGKPAAFVFSIAISPGVKQRGIGQSLLLAVEQTACSRGYSMLQASVRKDNFPAISLAEKAGFRRLREVPRFYSDGASAVRMEKRLSGQEVGRIGRFMERVAFATGRVVSR